MHILIGNDILKKTPDLPFFRFEKLAISSDYENNPDLTFHDFLLRLEKDIASITLPVTLTENYLDFSGLILAHHIRLTNELKFSNTIPIIIYSSLDFEVILKITSWANILLTPNVYYVDLKKYDFNSIKKSIEKTIQSPKKFIKEKFLERVDIKPPSNYLSHHSIDNELALLRWSEFLKCADKIPNVENNLQSGLYFKYQRALNPVTPQGTGYNYLIPDKGKILLIDDEAEKGWENFYKCFFQYNINNGSIKFETLQIHFKSLSQKQIIEEAKNEVEKFNPDVVLLDLRLCDADFNINSVTNPSELTGSKILEEIKKINKGIRVIITTASNKIWNYILTDHLGANDYIIKRGDSDVAEDIKNLKNMIGNAINQASFLKDVYSRIEEIKSHLVKNDLFNSDEQSRIIENFDVAYYFLEKGSQLEIASQDGKFYNHAYMELFRCIEDFLNKPKIFTYSDKCCYVNEGNIKVAEKEGKKWKSIIKYNNNEKNEKPSFWSIEENSDVSAISTDFKMSAVIIFFFDQDNSNFQNWPKIRNVRNKKTGHSGRSIDTNVKKADILNILEFQKYIFNKDNFKTPTKKGLE